MLERRWTVRLVVAHLIGAMLFASLGISIVPTGGRMTDFAALADADFPCAGHGCGCVTAEMCRTACCCAKPAPSACHAAASTCHSPAQPQPPASDELDDATSGESHVRGWTIRSASCAGRDHWLARHLLVHWLPDAPRITQAPQPLVGVVAIADPMDCSIDGPAIDPPPPRRA